MGLSPGRHELLSIFGLGLATLLVMNGYDTQSFVAESVLHSVHTRQPDQIDAYAGYYGQTVMYAFYSITTLFAPWFCYKVGGKWTLVTGSLFFTIYLCGFFHLNAYFFYISQALLGIGFALYYTGQGQYISEHSTRDTISRNSVLISAIGNQSMLLGGLTLVLIYVINPPPAAVPSVTGHIYREFGSTEIFVIFAAMAASSFASNVLFACLPTKQFNSLAKQEPASHATFTNQIGLLWGTITEVRIFALLPFFIFYGLHVAFWLITFPTSFAFSHHLANNPLLPAYYSISLGVGNLIVGAFIHQMSKRNTSFGLIPTMITQMCLSVCMYFLTTSSTPNFATMVPTKEDGLLFQPNTLIIFAIGVLHGMIDCCSCTMRSFVCTIAVPKKRLQAYCVAKLFQSLATCFGTFIAPRLSIYGWMMLLLGTQLVSAICFCCVCRSIRKGEKTKVSPSEIGDF